MARPRSADMRWLFFGGSGRLGRKPFLLGLAFWLAVLAMPVAMALKVETGGEGAMLVGFAIIVAFLPAAWSVLALGVKRLHDLGLPGYAILILFVPGVGIIAFILLAVLPSAPGANAYGAGADRPGH